MIFIYTNPIYTWDKLGRLKITTIYRLENNFWRSHMAYLLASINVLTILHNISKHLTVTIFFVAYAPPPKPLISISQRGLNENESRYTSSITFTYC